MLFLGLHHWHELDADEPKESASMEQLCQHLHVQCSKTDALAGLLGGLLVCHVRFAAHYAGLMVIALYVFATFC